MAVLNPQPQAIVVRSGKIPVTLGEVTFSTEETPNKWNIGSGEQMEIVTNLPGGGIVVDDFGNMPHEISWTAKLMGPNIWPRVQQLRIYRISGAVIALSWWHEQYKVKIKSFDPGYMGGYNEYDIVCTVIEDLNGAFSPISPASVDQAVLDLQSQAIIQQSGVANAEKQAGNAFPPQSGNTIFGPYLQSLWSLLSLASPLVSNLVRFGPLIVTSATEAISAVRAYQATISKVAPQYPYTQGLIASLQAIIGNVQSGTTSKQIQTDGGELFSVAAMQYGDVTQAFSIAQANGMVYPILPAGVYKTVAIPPAQSS